MDTVLQDLRYALRWLRRSPGFALAAIATLATCIGANTAMFSVVHAVLLRPLPYPEPERLLRIAGNSSAPDLLDMAVHGTLFEGFGGYRREGFDVPADPLPQRVDGALVTGSVLRLLGVPAARGRLLQESDDREGGEKVAVVSDAFWRSRMGGDPAAVGGTFRFASGTYRIVGVMPPGFRMPQIEFEVIAPFQVVSPREAQARGAHSSYGFTRVRAGVGLAQAQEEMNAIGRRLAEIDPTENRDRQYVLAPLHAYLVRNVRSALLLLLGAVTLVLLIGVANVVNLLLARAAERQREMAIRTSLGAGRGRLLRQLLVETLLLAFAGGLAGLVLAAWMLDLMVALGRDQVPALESVRLDGQVLAFTALVSLAVGVAFGLAPGLRGSIAGTLASHLKEGTRTTDGRGRERLRRFLVASEMALAVVLLAGAGLLLRSLHRLQSVDPGFDTKDLLTFNVRLPMDRYREIPRRTAFAEGLLERIGALPGVTAVGTTTELPYGQDVVPHNLLAEGAPPVERGREPEINSRSVSPGYFAALGVPLRRGRGFEPADTADGMAVGVVNEAAARLLFGDKDPLGRRVAWASGDPRVWVTVVGVVGDVRGGGLDTNDDPALYTPLAQERTWWKTWMYVAVRTSLPAAAVMGTVEREVSRVDKDVPLIRVRTMEQLLSGSLGDRRLNLSLLGAFAIVALALAAVGIHGVMSYAVSRRTREIGVRMALGARAADVLRLVLGQGLAVTAAGLGAGLLGALALRRVVESMLFGVGAWDPLTLGLVTLILLAVALFACLAPALRAARVEPTVALRYE